MICPPNKKKTKTHLILYKRITKNSSDQKSSMQSLSISDASTTLHQSSPLTPPTKMIARTEKNLESLKQFEFEPKSKKKKKINTLIVMTKGNKTNQT